MGCHFLLQRIFPTQGWNPGLLHCRQVLYHLSHQGSSPILKATSKEELGFPGGTSGKETTCQCRQCNRRRFSCWVGKISGRRAWQPTPVFLLENSMDRAWQATVHRVTKSQNAHTVSSNAKAAMQSYKECERSRKHAIAKRKIMILQLSYHYYHNWAQRQGILWCGDKEFKIYVLKKLNKLQKKLRKIIQWNLKKKIHDQNEIFFPQNV